jgi:hypothetical protein
MNRRIALTLIAMTVVGGTALPALAASSTLPTYQHAVCVTGSKTPGGPSEGICVWVPLPVGAQR